MNYELTSSLAFQGDDDCCEDSDTIRGFPDQGFELGYFQSRASPLGRMTQFRDCDAQFII
jgi:hypothetical protein